MRVLDEVATGKWQQCPLQLADVLERVFLGIGDDGNIGEWAVMLVNGRGNGRCEPIDDQGIGRDG